MGFCWGQSVNNLQAGDRASMDGGHRLDHSCGSHCSFFISFEPCRTSGIRPNNQLRTRSVIRRMSGGKESLPSV